MNPSANYQMNKRIIILKNVINLMSIVSKVLAAFSLKSVNTSSSESGGYWCHDCDCRIPASDVPDDESPFCPSCGEQMKFERSSLPSCAC